jgi:hypothetical protein
VRSSDGQKQTQRGERYYFGSLFPTLPAAATFRSVLFVSRYKHGHATIFKEQRSDSLPAEAH